MRLACSPVRYCSRTINNIYKKDGWVLTALSYNYVHLGSSCFSLGNVTGTIFASNLMINLTSDKFALSVFGKSQKIMSIE